MQNADDHIEQARLLLQDPAAAPQRPTALLASAALCAVSSLMLAAMVVIGPPGF